MITRKQFITLAEAHSAQWQYESELLDALKDLAEDYDQETDFIGLPSSNANLLGAVGAVLGGDYDYWCFECNCNFEKFNDNVTLKDGSHPNVHNFGELYDFSVKGGAE